MGFGFGDLGTLGYRVWGLGFGDLGTLGYYRVWGFGFGDLGTLGYRLWGLGVQGFRLRPLFFGFRAVPP